METQINEFTKTCDMTKYPELFRRTKWGASPFVRNQKMITPEIIENRNRMVEEFHLVQLQPLQTLYGLFRKPIEDDRVSRMLGNPEAYQTDEGALVAFYSPRDKYYAEWVRAIGFRSYFPMYSNRVPTYLISLENVHKIIDALIKVRKPDYGAGRMHWFLGDGL